MAPASYASLEVVQEDGQLVRHGVRREVGAAAQSEVVRRLVAARGSVQALEACDLDLSKRPSKLVEGAEAVLCGRTQVGDVRAAVLRARGAQDGGGAGLPAGVRLRLLVARGRVRVQG